METEYVCKAIHIKFQGDKFSPKRFKELTGLPIEILRETGEIVKRGIYKDKPAPYGLGIIYIDPDDHNGYDTQLQGILSNICCSIIAYNVLEETGVDEIIIDTECAEEAGLTFSVNLVKQIKDLNLININHCTSRIIELELYLTDKSFRMRGTDYRPAEGDEDQAVRDELNELRQWVKG